MARVLIVGGEERGAELAAALLGAGHAVRVVAASALPEGALLPASVERFDGDPNRPGTLKAALEHVTVACWLLGNAAGSESEVRALHGARLERFLAQTVDSSVRGLVYEAAGNAPDETLAEGRLIATELAQRNAIPLALITAEPARRSLWLDQALDAVATLLGRYASPIS
jgi:hypothetical protein